MGCGEVHWFYLELFLLSFCRLYLIDKGFITSRSVLSFSCSGRLCRLTDTSNVAIVGIGASRRIIFLRSWYIVFVTKIVSDQVLSEPLSPTDLISCGFILFFSKRWACSTLPCTILECFICRFKLNTVTRFKLCHSRFSLRYSWWFLFYHMTNT